MPSFGLGFDDDDDFGFGGFANMERAMHDDFERMGHAFDEPNMNFHTNFHSLQNDKFKPGEVHTFSSKMFSSQNEDYNCKNGVCRFNKCINGICKEYFKD